MTRMIRLAWLGLMLLWVLGGSIWAQELPFENSQFSMVQGLEVHHRAWRPKGEIQGNVLLVHGFCGSTFSWRMIIDSLLAEGFLVRAVDLPPFGYSDRSPKVNHSPSFQADLLWSLMDDLDSLPRPWHLMGHSMGGAVVGAMAARRNWQTQRVVFVDGVVRSVGKGPKWWFRWLVGSKEARGIANAVGKRYFFHFNRIENILTDAYAQPPDSAAVWGYLEPLKLRGTAGGVFDLFAQVEQTFAHEAADIQVPIFIIWGDQDTWVPVEAGQQLHQQMPESEMVVIPGAGHCPMETHVAEFWRPVKEFLLGKL
ncbi:MAG: alpha/beta hydrolase [Bacteroidota bacterium]